MEKKFPNTILERYELGRIFIEACYHFFLCDYERKLILEEYKIFRENPQIKITESLCNILM